VTTRRPDPRVELQAFAAVALDLARVDPDRRPGAELRRWYQDLAAGLGVEAHPTPTNRRLLDGALRLHRIQRGLPDPMGTPVVARAA
jgi:hypothetical protein